MDLIATPGRKKRRPNFPSEFRKALAQRACEPGVSVSQLAQENDINANMLFKWRRFLLAGKFDAAAPEQVMLPVMVIDSEPTISRLKAKPVRGPDAVPIPDATVARQSLIEIQIADATVRFDHCADLAAVRAVVRMLRA